MSCSNRIWFTVFILGILSAALGNALLPGRLGSQLILIGFLFIITVLIGKLSPWIFFYRENHSGRSSRRVLDHPERLPIISRFPNGDMLIAVKDKRFRMWRTDSDDVYCQEVSLETGRPTGPQASSASQASAFGIPVEMYRQLERSLRAESKFL